MKKKVHIIGSGLSGLVAATELLKSGHEVVMLDQEAGFGGGGVHGYGALEVTFLGGCIFSGLRAAVGINEEAHKSHE